MTGAAKIVTGLIAALHAYIAWFEMFAWQSVGPRVFSSFPDELFEQTTALAANQGIYNAFLVVGLAWSLVIADRVWAKKTAICFLLFVAVAGLVGAATVSPRIALVQTVPAVVAMLLWLLAGRRAA